MTSELGSPDAAAQPKPAYLQGLNDPQREAVESVDGPLLVLAGAGTGKTRVLTTRIGHILVTRRAWPNQILAVTFTNKAAREMRDRVAAMIGGASEGLWIGTFHAIATRMLRRHAELVGLQSNFTILDQDDQIRLVKQIIEAEEIDDKRWPARAVHAAIERFKDRGLTPDKVGVAEAGDIADGRIGELYKIYQDRLKVLNAADFGDLLLHCVTLFLEHPDVLADYQQQFHYVLVDEYQDSNVAQYLWLRLLAQGRNNICCVGDDDQSIYSWRGAEVGNILRFDKDFPGRQGDPAGTELSVDPADPVRRLSDDRPQQRAAGQNPVDGGRKRRAPAYPGGLGRRIRSALISAMKSKPCSAAVRRWTGWRSSCAPVSRCVNSKNV